MEYAKALQYIHSMPRVGARTGFQRMERLLQELGNPHKQLQFVHLAGTSGKGSVTAMMASVLTLAGYRTGRCVSPFVIDFRERMEVDGEMISQDELSAQVETIQPIVSHMTADGCPPTEFEVVTAIALHWFAQRQCDIVCLEVGIGGRLDVTNIIDCPLVTVITSIGYDHTELLGDTLEQIAAEKCGIIKSEGRTVCYPIQEPAAMEVIRRRCSQTDSLLSIPDLSALELPAGEDPLEPRFSYRGTDYRLALVGKHQVYNALTAIEGLHLLTGQGYPLTREQVVRGLEQTRFPARVEVLSRRPLVLLDGGHNPSKVEALVKVLKDLRNYGEAGRLTLVIGMMRDKRIADVLDCLAPYFHRIVVTAPDMSRALPPAELAERASEHCSGAEIIAVDGTDCSRRAVKLAIESLEKEEGLVITGSLYLAAEVRPSLLELFPLAEE